GSLPKIAPGQPTKQTGNGGGNGTGHEWWDDPVEDAGETPASVSLPLTVWSPLLPHHTGLTEIAIMPCLVPPSLGDFCNPRTTPEEDALKGKWVRVEKDLNVKTGLWYLNIYYRRSRRLDVPLITDILLLEESEYSQLPEPKSEWTKASGQLRDGVYPSQNDLYLWYKLRHPLSGIPEDIELGDTITEIDVQYGEANNLFWGFQKVNVPVVKEKIGKTDAVWVTYRKGIKRLPQTTPLHFSHDGKFKILQVADLHYSVSKGQCRDLDPSALPTSLSSSIDLSTQPCYGDPLTQTFLGQTLAQEKPDLVIFTGDQLNGQGTTWDASSVITKAIAEVVEAKIPWTIVFGNHDDESDMTRKEQMKIYKALPYAVEDMIEGPEWVDGVGNYILRVRSADPSRTPILTLYFLDSHAYSSRGWSFWKPAEYDWIKPVSDPLILVGQFISTLTQLQSQIDWFLEESKKIDMIERPFTPDGAKDLDKVWKNARDETNKRLAKPNALMFFHIPLPESYSEPDVTASGEKLDFGDRLDSGGAPTHNSGFFENGILKAKENDQDPNSNVPEVKVVGNGHCHLSEDCKRVKGVWMCFGGGSSFSGYGKIGFDRRFRVYEVSDYGETVRTYKRTEKGEIVGDYVLSGKGAAGTTNTGLKTRWR
ncbi:hypothetical protein FRC03_005045, partial [Tulasnella sp. 419]